MNRTLGGCEFHAEPFRGHARRMRVIGAGSTTDTNLPDEAQQLRQQQLRAIEANLDQNDSFMKKQCSAKISMTICLKIRRQTVRA